MESNILKQRSKNLAYEVAGLAKCEDEPIAFCGAIQPGGLLLVADFETLKILAASQNGAQLLGQSLRDVISFKEAAPPADKDLRRLIGGRKSKVSLRDLGLAPLAPGICFRQDDHLILEFEFLASDGGAYPVSNIQEFVQSMKSCDSIESACAGAAATVRSLSGFDRVMIYRFDPNWNGEVIAESTDRNDSLLGLRYPASDIPPQARELFFRNQSRMIFDVEAEAMPIVAEGFHPGRIDLSQSILRAVSPIHLQYLVNMGVRASFSTPLRVNEKLWGLISCHHYANPLRADREIRSGFELVAQILSGKINDLVTHRRLQVKNETLLFTQKLLAHVAAGGDAVDSFAKMCEPLLRLTESSGALVKFGNREIVLGQTPSAETIRQVRTKLSTVEALSVWRSDSLVNDLGIQSDSHAAGALAVPFSLGFEDALIWFRPEELREVRWGGRPKDHASPIPMNIDRLMPRHSFSEWKEKLADHSRPWSDGDEECAQFFLFGFVQEIFTKAQALSQAYLELERVAKAKDEFLSTISHELRTPLGIILGWIDVLKEYPQAYKEASEALSIIERNAKMQIGLINDLLDASRIISGKLRLAPQRNVDAVAVISDLVSSLKPTAAAKSITLFWNPPAKAEMTVDPDRLRQMIWNLVANAIKFTPRGGEVSIGLQKLSSVVQIVVEDNGAGIDPSKLKIVFERFAQAKASDVQLGGLGLGLSIVKALVELHGGEVEAFSLGKSKGTKFTVTLPLYAAELPDSTSEETFQVPPPKKSEKLLGLRILIAEDQPDSFRALQIVLERNGAQVLGADNGQRALALLKETHVDLILSDISMPEMNGYELIQAWRQEERRTGSATVPAIALTAHASSQDRTKTLSSGFQSYIPKPVDREELFAVIDSLGLLKKT